MGKDKKGKGSRGGGGKMYIENVDEMAIRDTRFKDIQDERAKRRADAEDEGDGSGSGSEAEVWNFIIT